MLTSPEEEQAARVLLHGHVADVHAPEDVLDDVLGRVQAGARRRRTVRRGAFALAALGVVGFAAAFAPIGLSGSAASARPASSASVGVLTVQNACPAQPEGSVADPPPVGSVPGYPNTVVPGKPVAAVACAYFGGAHPGVLLSATQLAEAVPALNAIVPGRLLLDGKCYTGLPKNGHLYLVFEYANGARLTVTAYGSEPCNGPSHVTDIWTVANTGAYGLTTTSAQAETLEALAALQPFH